MASLMGDEEDEDQDSIKEAFLETNFYLLIMTFVVSIVHSVFEFLAFKNGKFFQILWKSRGRIMYVLLLPYEFEN